MTGTQTTDGQEYPMSYGHNLAGNMTSEAYPSGKVILMEYDPAGRQAGVKKQGSANYYAGASSSDVTNRIGYTAHGGISTMRMGNGLWEHMLYNSRLQPTEIGLGSNGLSSEVFKLKYTYGTTNNNGNVQTQEITVPGLGQSLFQSYSYDSLNRLEEARENQGSGFGAQYWKQRFTYDRYGNRNFDTSPGQTTPNVMGSNPVISQANNRINVIANPPGWGYDPVGNLTSMPDANGTATMEYDGENRQVKFTSGGGAISAYSYDGDGRRVKRVTGGVTTVFVYNVAGQLIAEYDNSTSPPPGSGGTSYLTTDHLGSTRVVTGQDGSVKGRYDYLPFGEALGAGLGARTPQMGYDAATGLRQKFTQKERDSESGLDYFLARYYSPPLGRFTSPDHFDGNPATLLNNSERSSATPYAILSNPQTLNLYVYVENNPESLIDPDGHQGRKYEKLGRYSIAIDRRNPNDYPNIHVFDGKKQIGRVAFKPNGPEFTGELEKAKYSGLRKLLDEFGEQRGLKGQPRDFGARARVGRGTRSGSGVFAGLILLQILLDVLGQRRDAEKLGYHTNSGGNLVLDDPGKAAKNLGEGTKILIDAPAYFGTQPAVFVVENGRFVTHDARCPGCELQKDKEGKIIIVSST